MLDNIKNITMEDVFNFIGRCILICFMVVLGSVMVAGVTGVAYAYGFFLSFWGAYVCMHLWNWFIVPATGVAPISFFLMLGLMVAFHAIKGYPYKKDDKKEEEEEKKFLQVLKEAGKPLLTYVICYAFAFLTGWIIHTYLM